MPDLRRLGPGVALATLGLGAFVSCTRLLPASDLALANDAGEGGPVSCGAVGEACIESDGSAGSCCSGLGCAFPRPLNEDGAPLCCLLHGQAVAGDPAVTCCSETAEAGLCVCLAPGAPCWDDAMCCSNLCSGTSGAPGTCLQGSLLGPCQNSPFACSGAPSGQACECSGPPATTACLAGVCCSTVFGVCHSQTQCCGGNVCVNGVCLIPPGADASCSAWPTLAQDNEACMSGVCESDSGRCCSVRNQICTVSGDCCSGLVCPSGTCQPP